MRRKSGDFRYTPRTSKLAACSTPTIFLRVRLVRKRRHVGQGPVFVVVVPTIADHQFAGDLEADEIDPHPVESPMDLLGGDEHAHAGSFEVVLAPIEPQNGS